MTVHVNMTENFTADPVLHCLTKLIICIGSYLFQNNLMIVTRRLDKTSNCNAMWCKKNYTTRQDTEGVLFRTICILEVHNRGRYISPSTIDVPSIAHSTLVELQPPCKVIFRGNFTAAHRSNAMSTSTQALKAVDQLPRYLNWQETRNIYISQSSSY